MEQKQRGLGPRQIAERHNTEWTISNYIVKNQASNVNQIIKGTRLSPNSVVWALRRMVKEKRIRQVDDPTGKKNTKCYATGRYGGLFSRSQLEKNPLLSPSDFLDMDLKSISKNNQFFKLALTALIHDPIFEDGRMDEIQRIFDEHKLESKRKQTVGKKTHWIPLKVLRNIVILSETIYTKNKACDMYKITPKALDYNVKQYPHLQELRNYIKKQSKIAEGLQKIIIPIPNSHGIIQELRIVKRKDAIKFDLI